MSEQFESKTWLSLVPTILGTIRPKDVTVEAFPPWNQVGRYSTSLDVDSTKQRCWVSIYRRLRRAMADLINAPMQNAWTSSLEWSAEQLTIVTDSNWRTITSDPRSKALPPA